jgi:mycothiol synthase
LATLLSISLRSFHWSQDFDKIQEFLFNTYKLTDTFHNWIPSMFENLQFGPCGTPYTDEEDEYVKIWEDGDIGIVAVTICKPSGECYFLIHPEYYEYGDTFVEALELQAKEMKTDDSGEKIFFMVEVGDRIREEVMKKRGYSNSGVYEHNRYLPENFEVPEIILADGYSIRHVEIEKDFENYKAVQGSVFSHCRGMTLELVRKYASAKFYHPERDVVAVAPDGTFAAFTTGRMDPISKLAETEPVGVHPDHRQRGLGKAIVYEGIRRLQQHGAEAIVILGAASSEAATKLYDSIGFERRDVNAWLKII